MTLTPTQVTSGPRSTSIGTTILIWAQRKTGLQGKTLCRASSNRTCLCLLGPTEPRSFQMLCCPDSRKEPASIQKSKSWKRSSRTGSQRQANPCQPARVVAGLEAFAISALIQSERLWTLPARLISLMLLCPTSRLSGPGITKSEVTFFNFIWMLLTSHFVAGKLTAASLERSLPLWLMSHMRCGSEIWQMRIALTKLWSSSALGVELLNWKKSVIILLSKNHMCFAVQDWILC